MLRPSVLAVLRLIANSKVVGCSTGNSAGSAPWKILSTYAGQSPVSGGDTRAVRHKAAGLDDLLLLKQRRQALRCSECHHARVLAEKHCVWQYDKAPVLAALIVANALSSRSGARASAT